MAWNNYFTLIFFEIIFLISSCWIVLKRYKNKLDLYLGLFVFILYSLFIYFCANWYSINYYLRYVTVVICIVVVVISLIRTKGVPFNTKRRATQWITTSIKLFLLCIFIYFNCLIIPSFFYQEKPIELSFPFKNGMYCITDGGNGISGKFMNSHPIIHRDEKDWAHTLKYSIDVVKINSFGFSSEGIFPSKNDKYCIFGDTIYSPCDGEVVYAINNFPDNKPFSKYQSGANYLLIRYQDDIYVSLCHLQSGSLTVKEGDIVKKGQILARAGDSGGSPMPHLHMDVMKLKNPWTLSRIQKSDHWYIAGEPIPFVFDGKFPVRNTLFISNK